MDRESLKKFYSDWTLEQSLERIVLSLFFAKVDNSKSKYAKGASLKSSKALFCKHNLGFFFCFCLNWKRESRHKPKKQALQKTPEVCCYNNQEKQQVQSSGSSPADLREGHQKWVRCSGSKWKILKVESDTHWGIQGDDSDSIVHQPHSQEARPLLSRGHIGQTHAHHICWHLLPLCVFIQLSWLQEWRQREVTNHSNLPPNPGPGEQRGLVKFLFASSHSSYYNQWPRISLPEVPRLNSTG